MSRTAPRCGHCRAPIFPHNYSVPEHGGMRKYDLGYGVTAYHVDDVKKELKSTVIMGMLGGFILSAMAMTVVVMLFL
jgi:hypothetical protein